ncbi:zinc ribbon domain-containing protein [Actinoallomurus purpureus]|uniref:Zn-ribbon domain-containing OB-fold protein n=1 Tax=Actinoallomurus purpureus TaxID=478114 RepID=UPI002093B8D5|nr:zinc ribbon domain-containing protein [Actinoallomurus purpureus]MCO6006027.1 zinc ribbon domain-containing protein [Actinoallomurus purpureus]
MAQNRPGDEPATAKAGPGPVSVVDGWFTVDPPRLTGTRCTACGTVYFPPQTLTCRNPACDGDELVTTPLSDRGRIWSYADARYRPPPPYVSGEDFEPYAIAAVELAAERIVVLGQVVRGVGIDDLAVGMEVELVVEELDPGHLVWKWRPVSEEGE